MPSASTFTLKSFRAGKANALAAAGLPLGQILAAGEWRCSAILNYVDEDTFDSFSFLHSICVNSDDEGDVPDESAS